MLLQAEVAGLQLCKVQAPRPNQDPSLAGYAQLGPQSFQKSHQHGRAGARTPSFQNISMCSSWHPVPRDKRDVTTGPGDEAPIR